jgi:molybdate transport system substrate-binding protein
MTRRFRAGAIGVSVGVLLTTSLAACGESTDLESGEAAEPTRVRIITDGILEPTVKALATALEDSRSDVAVQVLAAPVDELPDQLDELNKNDDDGDDVDVVIGTASNVDVLRAEQVLAGDPLVFGSNMLVITVPKGNPGEVEGLDAFAADATPNVGVCAPNTRCGQLATYAFSRAGVEGEPDVTEADAITLLFSVVSGDLDAALLLRTQAASQLGKVSIIPIPDEYNQVEQFSIAPVRASPVIDDVVDWLASSAAAGEILSSSGLRDAPEES